jgi:hypothetical protein
VLPLVRSDDCDPPTIGGLRLDAERATRRQRQRTGRRDDGAAACAVDKDEEVGRASVDDLHTDVHGGCALIVIDPRDVPWIWGAGSSKIGRLEHEAKPRL